MMFLKQLDTVGFKSFAERIKVDFVPGVTAVVGPNGSGKSNITDAIRWVLGEQSVKSLRGAKMEDIIFQGSDTRKPLNFAEVTLVLDNSDQALPVDYEEVSVTRRIYRSGESEFYMNKESCRLKDITELFLDSGLGKEAFSIISQGKIEEILSSKADERRIIFEEAAGVLKYKNRKKQAESKLSDTQENVNRVEDIIYEIESQLDPLERQASDAKEYLFHKERLTNIEVGLLTKEIQLHHNEWEQIGKEIKEKKELSLTLQTDIQTCNSELNANRKIVDELDITLQSLQERYIEETKNLESLEGNKKILHERLHHFQENKKSMEDEIERLKVKKRELTSLNDEEKTALKQLELKRKDLAAEIHSVEQKLLTGKDSVSEDIEFLKSDYIELLNEQAAKRNERTSVLQQLERLDTRKDTQSSKWKEILEQHTALEKNVSEKALYVTKLEEEMKQLEDELNQLSKQLLTEEHLVQDMSDKLHKGYRILENIKSRKEMLEELKEDYQGFYFGVKEVLKARERNQLQGIHGAIAELIEMDDAYVQAIETALGGQAQHIVTDSEKAARNAIEWLKTRNKGRATFLPLASMQPKWIPGQVIEQLKNNDEFIGIADDLVQYDSKYKAVVQSLLGNIILSKSLRGANEIAKLTGRKYRIVTLDGDVVNPGGSMTGGAQKKNNQSLFTRERELQSLIKKLDEYERRIDDYENELSQQEKRQQEKKQAHQKAEQELMEVRDKYQGALAEWKEAQLSFEHLTDRLSVYDQDQLMEQKEREELTSRLRETEQILEEMEQQTKDLNAKIERLTEQLENFEQEEEKLEATKQNLHLQLVELRSTIDFQKEKMQRTNSDLHETEQDIEQKQQQLDQLIELKQKQQTEEELNEMIEQSRIDNEEIKNEMEQLRTNRSEKTNEINRANARLEQLSRQEKQTNNEIQALEIKSNRLDVELENRLNLLETEYEMTFEKAKQSYEQPEDIEEAKKQVKLLKKTIEELGTINLGAIEEYNRIKERYDFLSKQRQDLEDAKRTLYEVIAEMDHEMATRFNETFVKIQQAFTTVFQKLFGGGHAELRLTSPNEILDTGVDIIAQPPGKKLQQLGLLSGGERALTAIALLFAILQVRPVPFCVLDEVEAALDEANVSRFAQYLKQFSSQTQFIVITHRKGTMEEADVLYGVTMQESGVSRLVSVKLEEAPELLEV